MILIRFILIFHLIFGYILGQELEIPIDIQIPIIIKILNTDRNLIKNNSGETLKIGIVYQDINSRSSAINEKVNEIARENNYKFNGYKEIEFISIDFSNISSLKRFILKNNISVIYLTPLRKVDVSEITKLTSELKIVSISAVPSYINDDVTISIDNVGDHPQILINWNSVKAIGADFNSQMLKLCKIIY